MTGAARPERTPEELRPSRGVALASWMVNKTAGFLEARTSRRGFLVGSAVMGSAIVATGCRAAWRPGTGWQHLTDCPPGSLCHDGYTEFCCSIYRGKNECPPGSFAGGWWRADYSDYCQGTRYYIDCMQDCCGPHRGGQWCNSCVPCSCGPTCNNRKVYCNYFRYGQCHQEIYYSGPIACRVTLCRPPYEVDPSCSPASAVDNATASHVTGCLFYGGPPKLPPPPPAVLPSTGTALVDSAGQLVAFARVDSGGVKYRSAPDGTSWADWQSLDGAVASKVTAVTHAGDVYVFVRAFPTGALAYRRRSGGTWGGWESLGGTLTSDPAPVSDGGALYVFKRGLDKALWYWRYDGSWGALHSLGGTLTSDPAAVAGQGGVWAFARMSDHGLWFRVRSGGSWTRWQGLGGAVSSDVAPIFDQVGGVFVFARGLDARIWYRRHDGAKWRSWQSLKGPVVTSDPVAVSHEGALYVFARRENNSLYYKRRDADGWGGWHSLGGLVTADPAVASHPTGLYVFVTSLDRALHYRRFNGGSWTAWTSLGGNLDPVRGAGAR